MCSIQFLEPPVVLERSRNPCQSWAQPWHHPQNFPKAQRGTKCRAGSTKLTANIWKWEYRKIIDGAPYSIIDF